MNQIVKCDIDPKGRFAFTELRSVEETTALLQLDGIILVRNLNQDNISFILGFYYNFFNCFSGTDS